jgi:hypothetical protein
MKRNILLLALGLAPFLFSCGNAEQKPTSEPAVQDSVKSTAGASYACPMCPDQTSDKPAKCGTCGMDMEKKS